VLLRLIVAAVIVVVALLLVAASEDTVVDFEVALLTFFDSLPSSIEGFFVGLAQYLSLLLPAITAVALLVLHQVRALLITVVASAGAFGTMVVLDTAIDRAKPTLPFSVEADAWITNASYPDAPWVAAGAAAATVIAAYLGRRWGRLAVGVVTAVALLRLLSGYDAPIDLVLAGGVGWCLGAFALVAFGMPSRRPTVEQVRAALAACGLPVAELTPATTDGVARVHWKATATDGSSRYVKVYGQDERDADLLWRLYRSLRLKNLGDERPFSSLRRAVEHEALVALKARDVGVRAPRVHHFGSVDPGGFLLVYDAIDGTPLAALDGGIDDALLRRLWEQVARLRTERIAHRDIRQANLLVDERHDPWMTSFGFGELAAGPHLLEADIAQLLSVTALAVGAPRAVSAAVAVLGKGVVGDALPMLQPLALTSQTRRRLGKRKGLLGELRKEVIAATGVEEVHYEPLSRVSLRTLFMLVSCLVAVYVLIPQLSDVAGMVEQLHDASWDWVAATVVFSIVTFVGAGMCLAGASPRRAPVHQTAWVSVAGSFVNRITPAGIGGIGLNVRYLQKTGVHSAEAASAIGVNEVLGVTIHLSLTAMFLLWAGQDEKFHISAPEMPLLVALLVVLVAAGVVFVTPWGRRKLLAPARPVIEHAVEGIVAIARHPTRLLMMVGGNTILDVSGILGMYAAMRSFGGDLSFAAVGAVYLAGSAVARAAPTPGGIGAVEAALIAGLVSVGLDKETAVPTVLLFRLASFWLPVLPGWIAFERLSRRDLI
jgi:undecaprenyl-diphosphatase